MRKTMLKSLITIAFVVIVFVAIARILGRSETVSDYAAKKQIVTPAIEYIDENQKEDTNEDEKTLVDKDTTDDINDVKNADDKDISVEEDSKVEELSSDTASDVPDSATATTAGNEEGTKAEISEADSFYIEEISEELKNSMLGKSYADGIDETKVNFGMLRHVVILYNNFEGSSVQGELVCNEAIAQDLLEIFRELYYAGYQFEEISLIDKYDADDTVSMEHNNTSCFNYRVVDDSTRLSNHAYGRAIDLNPFYNPYVVFKKDGSTYISPKGSEAYADRTSDFPYKIDENDLAYKLFIEHGFKWGGNWNSCKDYQHFEKKQ